MLERYTSVIKIVKVVETVDRGQHTSKDTELLSLTVRDTTLEGLIKKTQAHLSLVEEAK